MKPVIIIFLFAVLAGCKKFVQIDPPIDQEVSATVFADDQSATSAVQGVYASIMASNEQFLNGNFSLYSGLSSDELTAGDQNAEASAFFQNALIAKTGTLESRFWVPAYNNIHQINLCLEGIAGSAGIPAPAKAQLEGEAHFLRALCYFYLVNSFGPIPLVTSSNYQVNQSLPRAATGDVYAQIVADLGSAMTTLKDAYPTSEPVRANKWSAVALLARVYLYQGNWSGADSAATAVIESGMYHLPDDLTAVFLGASEEAILQFQPNQSSYNTSEGHSFLEFGDESIPNFTVSDILLNAFEVGDQRPLVWLNPVTVGTDTYQVPFKYRINTSTDPKSEYNMVLRLAEQYLIRAEARAHLNNVVSAAADLNMVRHRAGLGDTPAADQDTLLTAIDQERLVEFFAEWGHRWFDLKRRGTIDAVLSVEKSGWNATDSLYPIPYDEIQRNPFLTQNTGY